MRQDSHPLAFGKLEWFGARFPVGRNYPAVTMVPVAVDMDQVLRCGEQGLEHLLVLFEHMQDQSIKIIHQGRSPVLVPLI